MIKIAALNDSTDESSNEEDVGPSEEALEADATRLYRNAISHLANNRTKEALESFQEVLKNPYTEKACWSEGIERSKSLPQEIALKYSCLKNLGNIFMSENKYQDAFDYYMKAVQLDSSEVTLWYQLGAAAIKIKDFEFAIVAFQEGLQINPSHWPCLDQLLSVLFILESYDDCLGLVIGALKRDPGYVKGLAFRDKIIELQPSIIGFAKEFFEDSEILFKERCYDKEKGAKFINTCIELRPPPKEPLSLCKISPRKLEKNLHTLLWVDLADSLVQTYDYLLNEEAQAFAGRLELENALKDYISTKFGHTKNAELKCMMESVRKLSRSMSLNEEITRKKSNSLFLECEMGGSNPVADTAPRARVGSRRQTIELGESRDTFRVGTRRSLSTDLESNEFNVNTETGFILCPNSNKELEVINEKEHIDNPINPSIGDKITAISNEVQVVLNSDIKESSFDPQSSTTGLDPIDSTLTKNMIEADSTLKKDQKQKDCLNNSKKTVSDLSEYSMKEICDPAIQSKITLATLPLPEDSVNQQETGLAIKSILQETVNVKLDKDITQEPCMNSRDGKEIVLPCIEQNTDLETKNVTIFKEMEKDKYEKGEKDNSNESENSCSTMQLQVFEEVEPINTNVLESDTVIVSEAAVNQLKDIMALKAPTKFNFENQEDQEFVDEYFDGGVYEDEDEDLRMDTDAPEPEIEREKEKEIGFVDKDTTRKDELGATYNVDNSYVSKDDPVTSKSEIEKLIVSEKVNFTSSEENELALKNSNNNDVIDHVSVVPPVLEHAIEKKLKRPKRGLERELEQLDYWGRRKAREAKKRRKTLTSRLVGAFEENEYLTWAHLLRSFIPAALLSPDDSSASKEDSDRIATSTSLNNDKGTIVSLEPKSLQADEMNKTCSTGIANLTEKNNKDSPIAEQTLTVNTNIVETTVSLVASNFIKQFCPNEYISQWNAEELQVGEFLYKFQNNGGIIDVMQHFQLILLNQCQKVWPLPYALAYKNIYFRLRKHIMVGATLSSKENPMRLYAFANAALTNLELLVCLYRLTDKVSALRENPMMRPEELFSEDLQMEDDIFHLCILLGRPDVWGAEYLQAHLRILWVQSQIQIALGNPENSAAHLIMLIEEMELATRSEEEPLFIDRCRVVGDDAFLTISKLKLQLNLLQRSQMLEKVGDKFRDGCYEEVINILTSVFDKADSKSSLEESFPPRFNQLVILVESLVKTNNLLGVLEWGAKALSEALDNFKIIESEISEEKIKWSTTVETILTAFSKMFRNQPNVDKDDILSKLPNFLTPLVDILVLQLEQSSGNYPYFNTLSPWLITHYILSEHEQKCEENMEVDTEEDNNSDNEKVKTVSPFPSTLLLITAHDELGKNSCCCHEEGNLLTYMMDVLLVELRRQLSEEQKLLLHQSLEQVIFCLYSHPSRKTKASLLLSIKHKHLRDHGVDPILLSWERALLLYKYYLPIQLPDFQSSQIPSISDDVVALYKKVLFLMGNEYKHANQTEHIDSFLSGEDNELKEITFPFPTELIDCYYAIADYYFKSKEWDLAIQYYKLDVSINPNRIDSWAPMGLAKKTQLETLLNSCDVIENEENFFKEAQIAVRCLDRALYLDHLHTNMWVEKGGLVYMIYSHSSRLLKQDLNPDLSIERYETLEKIKEDMMQESLKCFKRTLQIVEQGLDDDSLPDERWLYHYMLGKLAEKSVKPPTEVLNHYLSAAEYLHQIGAKYPMKISYNNPQEYAVEAMEMYFRISTYIFKYLHQREGKEIEPNILKLFSETIDKINESPFAKGTEKKDLKITPADSTVADLNKTVTLTPKRSLEEENETQVAKKLKKDEVNLFITNLMNEILDGVVTKSQSKDLAKKSGNLKDDDILVVSEHVEVKESNKIIVKCIDSWKLCITRFSHHYKSLYRIAFYYHHSKFHKDNNKARNFMFGSEFWQQLDYMPTNGLFHERKTYLQNPKNCNLFHGVWRIPHDEIDRPGSFAAHMYRCVSLCLEILQDTKDFYTVLEVALSLKNSPDKDKKYLRDNERELLSEHSTQVGLQLMKDKFRILFKNLSAPSSPAQNNRRLVFLLDVHKAYKYMSRHLPCIEGPTNKMLVDSYAAFRSITVENNMTLLREADSFCLRNSYLKRQSLPNQAGYGSSLKASPSSSHAPSAPRRGRPVGSGYTKEQSKGIAKPLELNASSGQSLAVQQAYKVYENLIQAQTVLNSKNLDSKNIPYFQGKYEDYKQQMLKYLQIPSVSQFFHASLQSLGTSAAKLPPPPPIAKSGSAATITKQANSTGQDKHSLSSLAARSQSHGISISAVSKKSEVTVSQPIKPNMSITLSPTKLPTSALKTTTPQTKAITNSQSQPSVSHSAQLPKLNTSSQSNVNQNVTISKSISSNTQTTTSNVTQSKPVHNTQSTSSHSAPLIKSAKSLHSIKCHNIPLVKTNKSQASVNSDISRMGLNVSKDISIVQSPVLKSTSNVITPAPLPKLPAGTTLSRHSEPGPPKPNLSISKVQTTCKCVEISKINKPIPNRPNKPFITESSSSNVAKTTVTITPSNKPSLDKKSSPASFQDAFQASIAKANSGFHLTAPSLAKNKTEPKSSVTQLSSAVLMKLAFGNSPSSSKVSKSSNSFTITTTSTGTTSTSKQSTVVKKLPDVIPLKLKDPLSTNNDDDEIITLD